MPHEYINYEQVKTGVQELLGCANTMEEIFNAVTRSMRTMTSEENFQGVASSTLAAEFEPFRGRFESYVRTVRRFGELFGAAEEALQQNETNLKKQADQLG